MNNANRKPEASTLSRSMSISNVADASNRNAVISGNAYFLDKLFPLYDDILKFTRIPPMFYQIIMLVSTIQMLGTSFWPLLSGLNLFQGTSGKIAKTICQITYFNNLSDENSMILILFVVITLVFLVILFAIVGQLVFFSHHRRFIRWTLYPTRITIEFLPLLFICPMGYLVGDLFASVIKGTSTFRVITFVLAIIYTIFISFMHYVTAFLFASSPYISSAPTSSWSGSFYFIFTINYGVWPILSGVITIFDVYYSIIIILLKLAVSVYLLIRLKTLPLVQVQTNAIVYAIILGHSSLDVLTIVRLFGVNIDYMYLLIVEFSLFFISLLIAKKIYSLMQIKLKANLSHKALENVTNDPEALQGNEPNNPSNINPVTGRPTNMNVYCQDEKRRYLFKSYGIDQASRKAEMYMRMGLAEHADLFIDWSLIKYVAEFYPSTHMLCVITQFLSYFPSESRLLSFFFVQAVVKQNLSFYQRFLLYEVHRVKELRQSSASSEITDKLIELKRVTQTCITICHDFWRSVPTNPGKFYEIRYATKHAEALYDEAIDKWPNNVRLAEYYSKFLIECATDFTSGIKYKHRSDLIEQGKNFVVDISFRSLIRAYPMYLKRNIVDTRGNFTINKTAKTGSQSSSSLGNSQMSTGTIDGELDIEIEEQLAKINFSHHRARLAYQRSLADRKSPNSQRLKGTAVWILLFGTAIFVFLFAYFYSFFQSRSEDLRRQYVLNRSRYGFDVALLSMIFQWLRYYKAIDDKSFAMYARVNETNINGLKLEYGTYNQSNSWTIEAINSLDEFITQVVNLAAAGHDVYTIMSGMINNELASIHCYKDNESDLRTTTSLKDQMSYLIFAIRWLITEKQDSTWNKDHRMCEILNNIPYMAVLFEELQNSMGIDQTIQKIDDQRLITKIAIPVIVGYFLLTEPFLLIFLTKMLREFKYVLRLMNSVDEPSKNEAATFFKSEAENDEQNDRLSAITQKSSFSAGQYYAAVLIPILLLVAIIIGLTFVIIEKNSSFSNLSVWMTYGVSRGTLMIEGVIFAALSIALPKTIPTNMTTRQATSDLGIIIISKLVAYNNALLRGRDGVPPCVNANAELDRINFIDLCKINSSEAGNIHDTYRCFALDRAVSFYAEIGTRILTGLNNQNFAYDSNFYHMFHLVNNHMLDPSYNAAQILASLASANIDDFRVYLAILCFGGILINILGFFFFWKQIKKLDMAYDGVLQLLRHLSPTSVVSNTTLLNYLLNRSNDKVSNKMTTSMSVIHMSKDSIICLNRSEIIEVVNQSITSLFGYTPEQLLGQHISTILTPNGAEEIFNRFSLMKQGQCSMSYETNTEGITDDDQNIPVHITILGICDNNSNQARSFAVILRDETHLQKQRQAAEEAKAQSEKLLFQILPRDIVNRLNAGETDISFVVPSASIIFIDIVKFSDYSSTLTPTQIMENLSTIFARFDVLCAKYPLITKIKLIGDVYMAAAGLFTPDENPTNHASQVVQFGLDVLTALEEINTQLDSSLQVRIGVNTDGPLIAGVLGTDKPLFDIIGDPINVAARLQSTCIPGTVQISQTCYDAIHDMNFNIEQRGEIVLKGKGKKMAYIVRAFATGSFFLGQESTPSELAEQ
ncbi:Adenylate and Guanylate cyclase catalytic domain containing protein [Tritrichomonas foetus]|uniref:Adenylate and Guanylate cyclase catalytic domain containing protein n=1 Tax=Tritrichomonas foetus TaxID=1144522 RepID=A0A1J4JM00_9EUKA|nr:Adenylate and Guanylate cyclase catalytic domain containing protein [Tritrichomonas foetus]|eukprot:OHT00099.1 Adenylate and Guanylate cyclase catalytic domain containing protein [Tritrichomonas foetus]